MQKKRLPFVNPGINSTVKEPVLGLFFLSLNSSRNFFNYYWVTI